MNEVEPLSETAPRSLDRVVASQRWSELAFLHWAVDPSLVAPLLYAGLRPDVHEGMTWVGLIPFRLDRARLAHGPVVPYVGDFIEVNVRLYAVDGEGRRGVVFRSLEASRLLAVLAARARFSLPYMWARTALHREGELQRSESRRIAGGPRHRSLVRIGAPLVADELALFLTARWGMFTRRRGRTWFSPNEHEPWRLHAAELIELDDELLEAAGFPGLAERAPDSVLWSPGVSTRFGPRVQSGR